MKEIYAIPVLSWVKKNLNLEITQIVRKKGESNGTVT
tara:strand:+ start:420 stop:530 length:111 start_codon:yes stop_codon:yes gene_type:complete